MQQGDFLLWFNYSYGKDDLADMRNIGCLEIRLLWTEKELKRCTQVHSVLSNKDVDKHTFLATEINLEQHRDRPQSMLYLPSKSLWHRH